MRTGLLTALSRTWLVWCLAELGEFAEASAHAEHSVRLADEADGNDPLRLMLATTAIGCLWLRRGEGLRALHALERYRNVERAGNFKVWSASVTSTLGYALASCGRLTEAIALLRDAVDQSSAMNARFSHSLRLAYLGEALLLAGRAKDALELAKQALDHAVTCRERGNEAYARRLVAEATAALDVVGSDATVDAYRAAIQMAVDLGMHPLLARCHDGLGKVYKRSARSREAAEHVIIAGALRRAMGIADPVLECRHSREDNQ
jgi:tetratricopeptide (TPR) repeat protein